MDLKSAIYCTGGPHGLLGGFNFVLRIDKCGMKGKRPSYHAAFHRMHGIGQSDSGTYINKEV